MFEIITRRPSPVGKFQRYIDGLDEESQANLSRHLANPDVSISALRDALAAEGFRIGYTAIWNRRQAAVPFIRHAA
jgi:hypothetical protein